MSKKETFTSGQVAEMLGIPARTARRYLSMGKIPATQNPITGTWTITREALVRFMQQHKLDTSVLANPSRIIVVDDEPAVLKFITKTLNRSDRNFIVDATSNGYDAMIKIGTTSPDLICLDIHMPGMDGKKVLKAIKKNPSTSNVKVLVVTGYPGEIDDMLQLGADDALAKPFKPNELLDKILALIPKTGQKGQPEEDQRPTT